MNLYSVARPVVIALMRLFYKIEVIGEDNILKDKGFILAANHQSFLDPIFMVVGLKQQVQYMAKKELFEKPVLGFLIRNLGAFPVSRGSNDTSALDKAQEIVKSGGVLGIYPEGTRSKTGKLLKAKSGTIVIASKTGADIVPAGITYTKRKFLRKGVTVAYGTPIKNEEINIGEGLSKEKLKYGKELLMQKIAELIKVEKE